MIINQAELARDEIIDHTACEVCPEDYLFLLRDTDHEFTIGLRTILACIAFAENQGAIPSLPAEWWCKIQTRYD